MMINLLIEWMRRTALRGRLLKRRAHLRSDRTPLIVIPGMFGTRLFDQRGRVLWGTMSRLYRGPSIVEAPDIRLGGLLETLRILPGLYAYDVYGGLIRFLVRTGGYTRGEDLFVLDYDWRLGSVHGAAELAHLVARIRGFGEERIDLVGLSTGGTIANVYLAGGHAAASAAVRKVVYVGTPQRGSFDALACLYRGFRFAPGGRLFTPKEAAMCQTSFDALPHPDERVFVDERGRILELDLYDPHVWRRLALADHTRQDEVATRLAAAAELHRLLDRPRPQPDSIVIGAAHLPTPSRALFRKDRAFFPPPTPSARDAYVGFTYAPGDGELPSTSLRALTGLDESRTWLVTPRAHHHLPSDPAVHRLVLEVLLATDRAIPTTNLARTESLRVLPA